MDTIDTLTQSYWTDQARSLLSGRLLALSDILAARKYRKKMDEAIREISVLAIVDLKRANQKLDRFFPNVEGRLGEDYNKASQLLQEINDAAQTYLAGTFFWLTDTDFEYLEFFV